MLSFCCWSVSGLDMLGVSSWPQILLVGQCLSLSRQKAGRLPSKPLRTLKYSHSGSVRMAMPNKTVVGKLTFVLARSLLVQDSDFEGSVCGTDLCLLWVFGNGYWLSSEAFC